MCIPLSAPGLAASACVERGKGSGREGSTMMMKRTVSALAALTALGSVPACAVIAGLEDKTVDPTLCWDEGKSQVVECPRGAGGAASSGSASSGVMSCAPGNKVACYEGMANTEGKGVCKGG